MAKKKKSDAYKVWAFMINAHEFILLSQEGKKVAKVTVENGEDEAKNLLTDEELAKVITAEIQREEYQILWIDDPVEDKEVYAACKVMEQKESDKLLAEVVGSIEHIVPEEVRPEETPGETHPENVVDDSLDIKVIIDKDRCEIKTNGTWMSSAFSCIGVGDIFRVFDAAGKPVMGEFECVEKPTPDTENEGEVNWRIKARVYVAPEQVIETAPEVQPEQKQFKPAPRTKIIDVECPETNSEHKMKMLIREIRNLKCARLASQQEYNEQIKVAEKALEAAAEGKSFKPMECTLVEDWEAGERRYIRPDNGEVALREEIPYEERQLKLDLPGPEPVVESNDTSALETVIEDTALTAEAVQQTNENTELLTEDERSEKCSFGILFGSQECKDNGCSAELQEKCANEYTGNDSFETESDAGNADNSEATESEEPEDF